MADKALFIPLKSAPFEAFADGSKPAEYRPYGKRWNEKTCRVGRRVVLSKGYGKKHRLTGRIRLFQTCNAANVPGWEDHYPKGTHQVAACIYITVDR